MLSFLEGFQLFHSSVIVYIPAMQYLNQPQNFIEN